MPISSCGAASGEELGAGASAQCPVTYSSSSTLPHTISAQYLGDSNFTGSTSTLPLTQVVDQALTSTSLSSSPTSAVVGESVTYTASVAVTSPGAGTPTGAVEFLDAGSAISSCGGVKGEPLGGGGNAVCTITYGAVAAHPITATYLGDINFASSTTSPALSEPVGQAATTTSLASSVSPSVVGQSVTYTASVSVNAPGAGSPTGSVAFYDGGSPISCASTATETLSAGSASCTVTYAASGPHTISATYSGDSNFAGSNTSPLTQTVDQAATTTSLASSVTPSVVGQSVTYKASVSVNAPGAGSPTGNVEFLDTGTAISGCGGRVVSR